MVFFSAILITHCSPHDSCSLSCHSPSLSLVRLELLPPPQWYHLPLSKIHNFPVTPSPESQLPQEANGNLLYGQTRQAHKTGKYHLQRWMMLNTLIVTSCTFSIRKSGSFSIASAQLITIQFIFRENDVCPSSF